MLEQITDIKGIQLRGGAITAKEKPLLGFGQFSMVQNMRGLHPGFEKRKGYRKLHTEADSTNQVMSLYQFKKTRPTETHFFGQFSDGDILEATNAPPSVTTGAFGAEVFSGSAGQKPASWTNINDKLIISNGVDQHKIYAGETSYVEKFIYHNGSASIDVIPTLGLDYTTEVTDGSSSTHASIDALNTAANFHCLFIKTTVPAESFTFTVSAANTNTSVLSLYYWNGAWSAASGVSDGTASDGKTFAQTGTVSFTRPSDEVEKYQYSLNGYWYQIRVSAALSATVSLTSVTYATAFESIANVWNGTLQDAVEVQVEGTTQYAVHDSGAVDIGALASGKKIMISCTDPVVGFYIDPGIAPNATGTTVTSMKYWNGSAFAAVSNFNDSTSGLSSPGYMTFSRQSAVQPCEFGNSQYYAYWYELILDSAVSADVVISIQCMPYFNVNEFGLAGQCSGAWKGRAIYSFDAYPEYIYITEEGSPFSLNGSEYSILEAGDGRSNKITAMRKFHNELMVWQEETGVEGGCLTLFQGYSSETFGKLVLSSKIGTFSDKTAAVVDGVLTSTATDESLKTLVFFLSRYGVCVSDGLTVSVISDDIQNYFDPSKSECIRRGYENQHFLFYDSPNNLLRIGIVSGATATVPNVFPVFDLVDKCWHFDTLANAMACMASVDSGSGQFAMTQVGGGAADGTVYQLNYGQNDISTAIDSYLTAEFNHGGERLQITEIMTQVKGQTAGDFTVTPSVNGVAKSAITLSQANLVAGQYSRRNRRHVNINGQHISIKIQHNTAGQDFVIEDFGMKAFVNKGQ